MTVSSNRPLTIEEAADDLGVSVNSLRWWRHRGTGPVSYKIGRRVRYDRADLDAWRAEQRAATISSTA